MRVSSLHGISDNFDRSRFGGGTGRFSPRVAFGDGVVTMGVGAPLESAAGAPTAPTVELRVTLQTASGIVPLSSDDVDAVISDFEAAAPGKIDVTEAWIEAAPGAGGSASNFVLVVQAALDRISDRSALQYLRLAVKNNSGTFAAGARIVRSVSKELGRATGDVVGGVLGGVGEGIAKNAGGTVAVLGGALLLYAAYRVFMVTKGR